MNIHLPFIPRSVGQTRRDRRRAAAFTLVEMLVAMTITLILIVALAQAYAVLGQSLAEGRAVIEMAGSFRFVAHRLQDDLDRLTINIRPPASEASGDGYFEILDGPTTDWSSANNPTLNMFGDTDDILAFTTRRDESPFIGEFNYQPVESSLAEIVWWIQNETGSDSLDEPFAIYRRVLLIRPDYDADGPGGLLEPGVLAEDSLTGSESSTFQAGYDWLRDRLTNPIYPTSFQRTDISIRPQWDFIRQANGQIKMEVSIRANSVADLTDRRNRFLHWRIPANWQAEQTALQSGVPFGFPYRLETTTGDFPLYGSRKIGDQFGDDLMLWNALGFDVQVFDPSATTRNVTLPGGAGEEALTPVDPGYMLTFTDPDLRRGRGVFADLGYGNRRSLLIANHAPFHSAPQVSSRLASGTFYTYCTWARRYEQYTSIDPAFDYDGSRFDDTPRPPYPHALRGIRVRLRAWEPDYRQVRQKTVVSHFVSQ